jgi:hypothetical protein
MKDTGIRERTVFLMMVLVFVLASIMFAAGEISAAPITIPGLYNTGVDDDGQVLPDGSKDEHYSLTLPGSSGSQDPFKIPEDKLPDDWEDAPDGSAWIGPNAGNSMGPGGSYSYIITFDLAGLNLSDVSIAGEWASDNSSAIYLNDDDTGYSRDAFGFTSLKPFILADFFVPGLNTLKFEVNNNGSGSTGLLVANLRSPAVIPVPGAVWLLGTSLIVLLAINRKLRR